MALQPYYFIIKTGSIIKMSDCFPAKLLHPLVGFAC